MIKLLGKNNDLRTEDGHITKTGWIVAAVSSVFGFGVFLAGRAAYGKALQRKAEEPPAPKKRKTLRKFCRMGKKFAKLIVN